MATTSEPVYVQLAPTAAYSRRRAGWFAGPRHGDCRLGTLRVVLEKKAGGVEAAEYGVCEDTDPLPPGVARAFILRNDGGRPGGKSREEFYSVRVGERVAYCSCKASQCGSDVCKHRDAILALLAKEAL